MRELAVRTVSMNHAPFHGAGEPQEENGDGLGLSGQVGRMLGQVLPLLH